MSNTGANPKGKASFFSDVLKCQGIIERQRVSSEAHYVFPCGGIMCTMYINCLKITLGPEGQLW